MVGSGLVDGVAMEDGSYLGLLADSVMSGLSSFMSSSLSKPPKTAELKCVHAVFAIGN